MSTSAEYRSFFMSSSVNVVGVGDWEVMMHLFELLLTLHSLLLSLDCIQLLLLSLHLGPVVVSCAISQSLCGICRSEQVHEHKEHKRYSDTFHGDSLPCLCQPGWLAL